MPKLRFPELSAGFVFLSAFALSELLLLTGTWQLAYLAGFLAGILSSRARWAIVLGALGVSTAWAAYLVYVFVLGSGLQLANLVGNILGVGGDAWWLLTLLTLVLGILLGAVGGFTGFTASRLFLWEPPATTPDTPKS